jgi:hypothetical protein
VWHQLPAALIAGIDNAAALRHRQTVDRAGRVDAEPIELVDHTPDADPLPVLAPGPIGRVEHVARQVVWDRHWPAGEERFLLVRTEFFPVFDIDREDQRELRAVRKTQRLAIG